MKTRVLVLYGGRSAEREVSRVSAASIVSALDPERYTVVPMHISPEGRWELGADGSLFGTQGNQPRLERLADSGSEVAIEVSPPASLASRLNIDVVFPVLHGPYGEDGTIQGLLEMAGVPYVGCGVLGSAVGMDKIMMKRAFVAAQLPVLPWIEHRAGRSIAALQTQVEGSIGYPCFVKPANMGSSVGITAVHDAAGFAEAVRTAEAFDEWVLVEAAAHQPREIEVAVLGDEPPESSVPGEIRPGAEFYTYEDKYEGDSAALVIPAAIDEHEAHAVQQLAKDAFEACRLESIARVDCFYEERRSDGSTGRGWLVNEVNTMPGFTATSMYPKLWEASGVTYSQLVERLITHAIERFNRRNARAGNTRSSDVTIPTTN